MSTEAGAGTEHYAERTRTRLLLLVVLLVLLLLAALVSLGVGSYRLTTGELFRGLLNDSNANLAHHLLWTIRLPRTVAAILAGASLGLAGCVMQTLLKNPLAAPSTLGVSQGAAFGAACAIILLNTGNTFAVGNEGVLITSRGITALCAFGGALLSILLILALATLRQLSRETVILAGVAMGAFLSACTMLLQFFASDLQVAATLFWTFGDLGKAGWAENRLLALLLIPSFCLLLARSWSFTALQWGDEVAGSLGVAIGRLRLIGLLLTSLLVAVTTAFLGIIAFVGLMAPHLMHPLVGHDQRYLLPASSLCGALLLLLADLVSRTVLAPVTIPVGIITSFAGAPLFLYLLLRRRPL